MNDRSRYSDDRLESEIASIWRAVNDLPTRMTVVEGNVQAMKDYAMETRNNVATLRAGFEQRRREREEEREERRQERRSNFKWAVVTVLSACGIVITALGLLLH